MHPSPFPQASGSSGSRPVNFAGNQIAPTASGTHTGEADSWIEVASHPSDSAYTSSSDEHIITAGLQVSAARRRRRSTFRDVKNPHPQTGVAQESEDGPLENGEGEEEGEDMGSMINEMPMSSDGYSSPDDDDDDDDNEDDSDDEASVSGDAPAPRTVFSASSQQRPFQGRSQMTPALRRHGPGGLNVFAPNHATDHDEVLRASLSTLLSCAAAARGLTKSPQQSQIASQQSGRVAVEGIRVVREDNLPSEASGSVNGMSRRGSVVSAADSTSSSSSPLDQTPSRNTEKAKRKTRRSDKKSKSKPRSKSSKPQETPESGDFISALGVSYATLAISAGAIVLLSAITFSAGYAMGREVGKSEGGLLGRITGGGSERGKAVVRGLSRAGGGGLRGAAGRGISMGGGIGSVTA